MVELMTDLERVARRGIREELREQGKTYKEIETLESEIYSKYLREWNL